MKFSSCNSWRNTLSLIFLCFTPSVLQESSGTEISTAFPRTQHALRWDDHASGESQSKHTWELQICMNQKKFVRKSANVDEKEKEKEEESRTAVKKAKKAGDHGRVSTAPQSAVNEGIGSSFSITYSIPCRILICVLACSQTVCEECGESFNRSSFRGKLCNSCRKEKWEEGNDNMMAEEAALDEFYRKYFQTPEFSSSSLLASTQTEMKEQRHSKKADGKHVRSFERQ